MIATLITIRMNKNILTNQRLGLNTLESELELELELELLPDLDGGLSTSY